MGNVVPEPHTENGLPDWAWGVLVAAIVVTLLWLILLVAVIVYELYRSCREQNRTVGKLPPTTTLNIPPDPTMPHGEPLPKPTRLEPPAATPSPTPPVATFIDRTLDPSPAVGEEQVDVHLEGGGDDTRRPVSLAVVNEGIGGDKEFTLKRNSLEPGSDDALQTTTFVSSTEVVTDKGTRYESGDELEDDQGSSASSLSAKEGGMVGMVLSRPVTVRQLGATLRELGYLESEFRKLPANVVDPDDIPPGAEKKNRYTNVLPTTKTRVPLSLQFARQNSDYINANFIRGYRTQPKQYIATQGPMENTVEDFWRMVWEHGCEIILMATNFQERGIDKCVRYWPAQGSEEYGALEITNEQQSTHFHFNTTILLVKNLDTGEVRTVHHYRLTCWPTQGIPTQTQPITDSLQEIKMADSTGPAVVHCSAGIGRTGILIAMDIGIQALLQGDETLDVLRVVSTLRQDRAGAVLTRDQYRFIHQALYDVAREIGK